MATWSLRIWVVLFIRPYFAAWTARSAYSLCTSPASGTTISSRPPGRNNFTASEITPSLNLDRAYTTSQTRRRVFERSRIVQRLGARTMLPQRSMQIRSHHPTRWCAGLFVPSYPTGSGREQFISVIEQQNGSSLDCGRGRPCICCFQS